MNLLAKRIKLNYKLFKLSSLNSNFALALAYLNPAKLYTMIKTTFISNF